MMDVGFQECDGPEFQQLNIHLSLPNFVETIVILNLYSSVHISLIHDSGGLSGSY